MSEAIWCTVRVKVPASWDGPLVRDPCAGRYGIPADATTIQPPRIISDLAAALGNSDSDRRESTETYSIWCASGEGNYGLADGDLSHFLDWLEEHGVPYRATDDPKYEFQGTVRFFDGETVREATGDSDGQVMLPHSMWIGWLAKETKSHEDINRLLVAKVSAYFDSVTEPALEDVDISHLPAVCPYDEEDE